jgi:hypothetical protein
MYWVTVILAFLLQESVQWLLYCAVVMVVVVVIVVVVVVVVVNVYGGSLIWYTTR